MRINKPTTSIALTCFLSTTLAIVDESAFASDGQNIVEYAGAQEPNVPPEEFGKGVRAQEWKTPEQELDGLHLPPGFEINLFASEPDINKPLNMAWDQRGRLWITNTLEYPYPASEASKARDSIKILEDTTGDGRADKIITFADGLNIPMGLLPVADGVICFSIPYIWHLQDLDGDDRVDERIKLLGPFDTTRDTHGMINAMRLSSDGWVYACHGFNNQSRVKAADGSEIYLQSGNTFRFRPDGSRVEQFTQGQVNPFGMTRDEFGNWYTADCHSKPITGLLPGGCYSSFGRPDDGLGFAPEMMSHLHGSTAICGLHYLQSTSFPTSYRKLFYSGNVMTSRINCNRLDWAGSTPKATELPDFLTSEDTWFRPVDIQMGPDGALYVADFYNKIIGHYEVDLEHPGRDRTSGRIWRIRYTGDSSMRKISEPVVRPLARLQAACLSGNQTAIDSEIRRLASDKSRLLDNTLLVACLHGQENRFRLGCFETLSLKKALNPKSLSQIANEWHDKNVWPNDLIAPVIRIGSNLPATLRASVLPNVRKRLANTRFDSIANSQVARACIEFIGTAGQASDLPVLFRLMKAKDDAALSHMAKIAARNILRETENLDEFESQLVSKSASVPNEVYDIAPGVNTPELAEFLLKQSASVPVNSARAIRSTIKNAIAHPSAIRTYPNELTKAIRGLIGIDRVEASQQLLNASRALADTAIEKPSGFEGLWTLLLENVTSEQLQHSGSWTDEQGKDWPLQARKDSTGNMVQVRSSHSLGESYMGTLASTSFPLTKGFNFLLVGHNGKTDQPSKRMNYVRLVDVKSGLELAKRFPPRSDIAKTVSFPELSSHIGAQVRLEVIDQDSSSAYAWIAVGEFSIDELNSKNDEPEELAIIQNLLSSQPSAEKLAEVRMLLDELSEDSLHRVQLLQLMAKEAGDARLATLVQMARKLRRPDLVANSLVIASESDIQSFARALATHCDAAQRKSLSEALLTSKSGASQLVTLITQGTIGYEALRNVKLPEVGIDEAVREALQELQGQLADSTDPTESLESRISKLDLQTADRLTGEKLFETQCANCHQLRGKGKTVCPQLDGAISRSVARLVEDILAPSVNVDSAFRQSTLLLDDDSIVAGLIQDRSATELALIGNDGKETLIQKAEIVQRKETKQSLMPANFGELLSDEQLSALLSFLKN